MKIQKIDVKRRRKWSLTASKISPFEHKGFGITWLKGGMSTTKSYWVHLYLFIYVVTYHYFSVNKEK